MRTASTPQPLSFPTGVPIPAKESTTIKASFNLDARAVAAATAAPITAMVGNVPIAVGAGNGAEVRSAFLADTDQYLPFFDYAGIVESLKAGGLSYAQRFDLALKAFEHTAAYDGMIANYLGTIDQSRDTLSTEDRGAFPRTFNSQFIKAQEMRYGENPHQSAAFYVEAQRGEASVSTAVQLQGKELSFNNVADTDAALECVKSFVKPACVIVKHANPCGVAVGKDAADAYSKAFQTDPTSAFGGIIALNRPLDKAAAELIVKQFVEVLMAPAFTPEALEIFKPKANVRLMQIEWPKGGKTPWDKGQNAIDMKRIGSGILLQTADNHELQLADLRVVTKLQPTEQQLQDMLFAWNVAKFVKSNAIVFCKNGMTMGVGAGQMSRLDSARIASIKAEHAGLSLQGTAVASDAFFPFRDGLDVVIDHGASCVIQPGGSMRDQEVIDAADERGVVMVFSGVRHFWH